jgi:hypothetical protein
VRSNACVNEERAMIGDVTSGTRLIFEYVTKRGDKSQQSRKDFFNNFVEPVYRQLDAVHRGYMEAFQSYREIIAAADGPFGRDHPVFAQMEKDWALSNADRAQMMGLSEYLDIRSGSAREAAADPAGRFAQHVIDYVFTPSVELQFNLNAPRRNLAGKLLGAFREVWPEEKKAAAARAIDEAVANLQKQYLTITHEYTELKASYLV